VKVTIHRPAVRVSATRKIGFGLCGELLVTQLLELQKVPVRVTTAVSPVIITDPAARLREDTCAEPRLLASTARAGWLGGST